LDADRKVGANDAVVRQVRRLTVNVSSWALILGALLALSSCATPPPTVDIPVGISCLPAAVPARPASNSNADLKAMDDERLVLVIAQERLELLVYSAKAEAVIQGCK